MGNTSLVLLRRKNGRSRLCDESKFTFDVSNDAAFSLYVRHVSSVTVAVGALNLDFTRTGQILMDGKLMRGILSLTLAFLALLRKGNLFPTSFPSSAAVVAPWLVRSTSERGGPSSSPGR